MPAPMPASVAAAVRLKKSETQRVGMVRDEVEETAVSILYKRAIVKRKQKQETTNDKYHSNESVRCEAGETKGGLEGRERGREKKKERERRPRERQWYGKHCQDK